MDLAVNSDSTFPRYEYQTLPSATSIRLLDIVSLRPDSGDIEGKLHGVDLASSPQPKYMALSYTWELAKLDTDTLERPEDPAIVIDKQRLPIGQNLYDFLKQALAFNEDEPNDPDEVHLLWIDAVCVNQQDLAERSAQVILMRYVYGSAAHVIVWLGQHDLHSRIALPLIASFAELDIDDELDHFDMFQIRVPSDLELYEKHRMKPLSLDDWKSVRAFYSRHWFHRLWTVQEVAMAKDAGALCGDTFVKWEDILQFVALAVARGWYGVLLGYQYTETANREPIFGADSMSAMRQNYRASFPSPNPKEDSISNMLVHAFQVKNSDAFTCAKFAWAINLSRSRRASDQRDKVFAPHGLTHTYKKPADWDLLQPKYTQPVSEVFTRATRYILRKLENLAFLSFVEDKSIRTYPDLPSWVPDFSKTLNPLPLIMSGRDYNVSCGFEGIQPL